MKSWHQAIKGRGKYIVITNDPQTRRVCREHNIPTMCVEHSDQGLPMLDKMFERMQKSQSKGIIAYANSDITVRDFGPMYDFLNRLEDTELEIMQPTEIYEPFVTTGKKSDYWFAVSTRMDIDANDTRRKHTAGGFDFWAWNTKPGGMSLLPFDLPPFRFPFANYDNWILDMVVQSARRNAIDASEAIEIYHYEHTRVGKSKSWYEALMKGVTGVYMNRYFAYNEPRASPEKRGPSFLSSKLHHIKQFGTPVDTPYQAYKTDLGKIAIRKRKLWSNVDDQQPDYLNCTNDPNCKQRRKVVLQNTKRAERDAGIIPFVTVKELKEEPRRKRNKKKNGLQKSRRMESAATKNWRYTLKEQLKSHATENNFVLLTAVNFGYREHLMNFKCGLERVGAIDNFVIAAMDTKMYEWGVRRGLPIYLAASAEQRPDSGAAEEGGYGSEHFRYVTKLKSQAVLEVLNAGYSVVWSDVDITWFYHPFDALAGFMKKDGGIAIQSNAPYVQNKAKIAIPHKTVAAVEKSDDPASPRRLNSGLYVAPSNPLVQAAFQEILDHAAKSKHSEQPSFDEILCSRHPSSRSYSSCSYRPTLKVRKSMGNMTQDPLHVELLDRASFPNGAVLVGGNNDNVYKLGQEKFSETTGVELFAAHNNWISGETAKQERQEAAGWWFIDKDYGCSYRGDHVPTGRR